jgi:hypothetical protein
MLRPKLEVADIFRDHGAAWRAANAGHVSLDQKRGLERRYSARTAGGFCNGESSVRRRLSLDAVLLKLRVLYRCFGCGQHARALKRASFWHASIGPGGLSRRLLREAKLMMRNRLAGARPISYQRVGRAIGQAGNGPVTAETEIFRGRVAHRPAAMPLLKFEQRVGLRTLAGYFW